MLKKRLKLFTIKTVISCFGFYILCVPSLMMFATENGEAGNTGEIEFYLEEDYVPPKLTKEKKPAIRLPQTSNQVTLVPKLIGGVLLISAVYLKEKRRRMNA